MKIQWGRWFFSSVKGNGRHFRRWVPLLVCLLAVAIIFVGISWGNAHPPGSIVPAYQAITLQAADSVGNRVETQITDANRSAVSATSVVASAGATGTSNVYTNFAKDVARSAFDRRVVKNADVTLQLERVPTALDELEGQVAKLGGYVQDKQLNQYSSLYSASLVVRVPANRLEQFLSSLHGSMGKFHGKFLHEQVTGVDLTEEYVDNTSELGNLQVRQQRYRDLLDRASKVTDLMKLEQQLSQIQSRIAQIKGRQQYIDRSTALSKVSIQLEQLGSTSKVVTRKGFVDELRNSFMDTISGLLNLGRWCLIGLSAVTPVVILVLIGWLVWWLRRKSNNDNNDTGFPPSVEM